MYAKRLLPLREELIQSVLRDEPVKVKKAPWDMERRSATAVASSKKQGLNVKTDEFFYQVRYMYEKQGRTPSSIATELKEEQKTIDHILKYNTRCHIVPGFWSPKK